MEEFKLTRTGLPPLAFGGEKLAEADSKQHQGPLQNRWHELAVYRTAGGKWVGAVVFRTIWQGEHDRHTAEVADTPAELVRLLTTYDPTGEWEGFPDRPEFAEKQARTQAAVTDGYRRAVSEVFAGIDDVAERLA
jgi:hypothetical protein